jgi:hypothetical protein
LSPEVNRTQEQAKYEDTGRNRRKDSRLQKRSKDRFQALQPTRVCFTRPNPAHYLSAHFLRHGRLGKAVQERDRSPHPSDFFRTAGTFIQVSVEQCTLIEIKITFQVIGHQVIHVRMLQN